MTIIIQFERDKNWFLSKFSHSVWHKIRNIFKIQLTFFSACILIVVSSTKTPRIIMFFFIIFMQLQPPISNFNNLPLIFDSSVSVCYNDHWSCCSIPVNFYHWKLWFDEVFLVFANTVGGLMYYCNFFFVKIIILVLSFLRNIKTGIVSGRHGMNFFIIKNFLYRSCMLWGIEFQLFIDLIDSTYMNWKTQNKKNWHWNVLEKNLRKKITENFDVIWHILELRSRRDNGDKVAHFFR